MVVDGLAKWFHQSLGGVTPKVVVDLLMSNTKPAHHMAPLFTLAKHILNRQWSVKVSHTYREANFAAHRLANWSLTLV